MAYNSKREKLLRQVASQLAQIEDMVSVRRAQPFDDAMCVPRHVDGKEFPFCAVIGGLPELVKTRSIISKGLRWISQRGDMEAKIHVNITCYLQAVRDRDLLISHLADEIWRKLWEDPTFGGIAHKIQLTPNMAVRHFAPYAVFNFTCEIYYMLKRDSL